MGEATRNVKVTPSGIPASTNPRKRGIAEHEQNGVTIPNDPARMLPVNNDFPSSAFRVFSGEKNERRIPARKITRTNNKDIFSRMLMKNQSVSEKSDSSGSEST